MVIDGNKVARAATPSGQECAAYSNSYGYNMRLACNGCALTNSVTRNANCTIQANTIWHTDAFSGGAFAALMIHAWPTTSGDFTGSVTTDNYIDCGSQKRCGIGLYLGSDAWYITDVYGVSVHHNTVRNAQQGVLIDDVHDMEVHDNPVENPALFTNASCGLVWTHAYGIGNRSYNVDTSSDTIGTQYVEVDWDGCIPNWWNQ